MATPGPPDSLPGAPADVGVRPPGGPRGIVANVAYSLVSQLTSGVFTAVLTLYLIRALAPTQYGNFALAVGVGALVVLPADFGVSSAAARFVAEHRGDAPRVAAILADAVRLKLIASGLACGALAILAGPIAAAYDAPLTWPLRLVAVAVLGQNLMFLFAAAFSAAGRTAITVRLWLGESGVEASTSVVIVALGGGVAGATAGRAVGYAFGALLALVFGARAFHWPPALRRHGRPSYGGRIARYAAPLMLVDGANALFSMVDVLLIGAYLGSRSVGLFSAPLRLLALFAYFANAVSNGVAPRMVRGNDGEPDVEALAGGLRGLILFYSLLLAPLLIWTKPLVDILLGTGYGGSITTMRVLSLSVYLGGLAPLISASANYLGDAGRRVPLMIGAALLDGAIDVVLIPRIGIVSGAIATAVAYAVMLGGHLAICSRHVQIPYARIVMTAARALGAAAAMGGVLALFGSDPSVPVLVAGGAAGIAAYALALALLGEVSRAELVQLRKSLRVSARRRKS